MICKISCFFLSLFFYILFIFFLIMIYLSIYLFIYLSIYLCIFPAFYSYYSTNRIILRLVLLDGAAFPLPDISAKKRYISLMLVLNVSSTRPIIALEVRRISNFGNLSIYISLCYIVACIGAFVGNLEIMEILYQLILLESSLSISHTNFVLFFLFCFLRNCIFRHSSYFSNDSFGIKNCCVCEMSCIIL